MNPYVLAAAHLVRPTSSPREDNDTRRTLPGAPNGQEETP